MSTRQRLIHQCANNEVPDWGLAISQRLRHLMGGDIEVELTGGQAGMDGTPAAMA
ncbi:hypothetical protein ABEX25_29345 [Paenibacillus thiaminolyticus]|uniref:hypothetical protein n=1 Tax=Paenibacillus thiaminolyticus TaxID=49283 RepID=UPI003D293535